jgi:hypothetical protein
VTARVAGQTVWFESSDLSAVSAPEAFLGAFLIPALHHDCALRVNAPLSAAWLSNIERLTEILAAWWGYPQLPRIMHGGLSENSDSPGTLTGLCFTAGVDSFYSLFQHEEQIDALVFVHGFDIPLRNVTRADGLLCHLQRIAEETDKRLVCVRTNLRDHRLFRSVPWERTHGAALATVGHLLRCHLDTLMIASSLPTSDDKPWGSHWMIDGLWSTDGLRIVPELTPAKRWDKIAVVGGHPLAQQHLQVCWKNQAKSGNCSRCEKCLRTMVVLAAHGALGRSRTFDLSKPVPERLDCLPWLDSMSHRDIWSDLSEQSLPAGYRAAILRLLERSTDDRTSRMGPLARLLRAA